MRRSIVFTGLVLTLLLVAGSLSAQTTTGRLIGRVVDEQGLALPGVTVSVASEALLGGTRAAVTDARGEYSLLGLPPGHYQVSVNLEGFQAQQVAGVKVSLGSATAQGFTMRPASFAGEVEVTATTPVVDPTQVNTEQIFDREYLAKAAVGSNNRGYQNILFQAAGAAQGQSQYFDTGNPMVFGSSPGENAYFIDGIDTTDPVTSTFGTNFTYDAIEEIQFQTAGFEAEYGRAIGGVVNLVTKSGGNSFSGTADVRYRNDSFQEGGDHYDTSQLDSEKTVIGLTLGGPIVRDKVWFFLGYNFTDNTFTPIGSPTAQQFVGHYALGKVTWQIDPAWRLVSKFTTDPATIDNINADAFVEASANSYQEQEGRLLSFELNSVLSDSLMWNSFVGVNRGELNNYPMDGDPGTISHLNLDTGVQWANPTSQEYSERDRDDFGTNLTWFVDNMAGSHEFKGGIEYARMVENSALCTTGTPNGEGCVDNGVGYRFEDVYWDDANPDLPWLMWEDGNAGPAQFEGDLYTAYVQDSWRIIPNLTLKLGLRWDNVEYANNVGDKVADMDKLQPRLGAAWDITGDARNVVRLSWGRFMHPANTSLPGFLTTQSTGSAVWLSCTGVVGLAIGDPVSTPDECAQWAADRGYDWMLDNEGWDPLGWYLNPANVFAGAEPNGVDPNLEAAYADELIVSYERGIWQRSALELSFVDKATRRLFEDTCSGNIPTPSPDADCDNFVVANLDPLKRDYQGFVVRFESRDLDWLTLLASYVYSESEGSADERHYFWEAWDVYPWHWENRYGYLQDHRDHRVKLNGYFLLPYDVTIGFDSFWSSEFRYTPQADSGDDPNIPYGTYFVEPRGSGKAYQNYQFDLQLAKGFNVGSGTRIEAILSVFNLFSNEQPIEVCESISGCLGDVELGGPTDWQNPRRYELGFRFEF